ncbi:MAG: SpoIID/LytB domain-containing protein, partial [Candidatus Gracilibacteria bacterium]
RNLGSQTWKKSSFKMEFIKEQDLTVSNPHLVEDTVKSGEMGTIQFTVKIAGNDELGKKSILIKPSVSSKPLFRRPVYYRYTVVKNSTAEIPKNTTALETEKNIRVKIGFSGNPTISANDSFDIYDNDNLLTTLSKDETAAVTYSNLKFQIKTSKSTYSKSGPLRFVPKNSAIIRIDNFERRPSWNTTLNDNEFRGTLEVRYLDDKLVVINELPLESYLKGLAEASNSDPMEKVKAVIVAARSYARYYLTEDQKFPGKPYNLDDDPAVSQKYLGYGFEKRSSNISSAVEATKGEVVYYQGKIVKTPYFSSTDGTRTRSALDVWKWDAPYLVSVDDSSCKGTAFAGHGVGLSGCGAKGLAEKGSKYTEILKHYYTGIEIVDLY